jgi:uncharacterized SAM-binding protein YcdF (DUF218 family)
MFFVLSKILYFFVQPIFWIIVLAGISLFSKVEKRKKRARKWAFILLILFTNPWLASKLEYYWSYPAPEITELKKKYPVGIVLGGFSNPSGLPASFFHHNPAGDRISTAVELYHFGIIDKILITSGSGRLMGDQTNEADYTKEYLMRIGIPDTAIIVENQSKNTYENARETYKLLQSLYPNEIPESLLITSPFHMRRSLACFSKAGFYNSTPFSAGCIANKGGMTIGEAINPNVEALLIWERILKEMMGMMVYKMKGYI